MLAIAQNYPFAFQVCVTGFRILFASRNKNRLYSFRTSTVCLCLNLDSDVFFLLIDFSFNGFFVLKMAFSTVKTSAADLLTQVCVEKKKFSEVCVPSLC